MVSLGGDKFIVSWICTLFYTTVLFLSDWNIFIFYFYLFIYFNALFFSELMQLLVIHYMYQSRGVCVCVSE